MGRFPIEPVDIVLSEDNEPVQKPACRVPVATKDKFKENYSPWKKRVLYPGWIGTPQHLG